jgi:LPXTG-motif cell wall-anchored protein
MFIRIRRQVVAAVVIVGGSLGVATFTNAPVASAQCQVTSDNFTSNGTFDTEGYVAASAACAAGGVPSVAVGSALTVVVNGCAAGNSYSVRVQGPAGATVTANGTSAGSVNTSVVNVPANWTPGVTNVVLTCSAGASSTSTVRRTINLVAAGTSGAVTSVEVGTAVAGVSVSRDTGTAAASSSALSHTGSDTGTVVSVGIATILMGSALVVGVRRRRNSAA